MSYSVHSASLTARIVFALMGKAYYYVYDVSGSMTLRRELSHRNACRMLMNPSIDWRDESGGKPDFTISG